MILVTENLTAILSCFVLQHNLKDKYGRKKNPTVKDVLITAPH